MQYISRAKLGSTDAQHCGYRAKDCVAQQVRLPYPFIYSVSPGCLFAMLDRGVALLLLASLISAVLALGAGIMLSCPAVQPDRYSRLFDFVPATSPPQSWFCFVDDTRNNARNAALLLVSSALGAAAASYSIHASICAFTKWSHRGISTVYARALLQEPGQYVSMAHLLTGRVKWGSGKKGVQLGFLVLLSLVPLLCSGISVLVGTLYSTAQVRQVVDYVNTTDAPDWVSIANLTKEGFYKPYAGGVDDAMPYRFNDTRLQSRSLYQFSTNDLGPILGQGSGLQTVLVSYPPKSPLRTMGVIPLRNIPLEVVPNKMGATTFEQEVLLVDQQCSYGGFNVIPGETRVGNVTRVWLALAGWPATEIDAFEELQTTTARKLWIRVEHMRFESAALNVRPDEYNSSAQPHRVYYNYTVNDTSVLIYTASKDGPSEVNEYLTPMACRVQLVPVRYNTTVAIATSSTRYIEQYEVVKFSTASKQLVESALQLTKAAMDQMDACAYRCNDAIPPGTWRFANSGGMYSTELNGTTIERRRGDDARSCKVANGTWAHAHLNQSMPYNLTGTCDDIYVKASYYGTSTFTLLPLRIKKCRPDAAKDARFGPAAGYKYMPIMSRNDSCASTEFEKLLFSHLLWLSSLPADKPEQRWGWGPLITSFNPIKERVVLLLGVLICLVLVMLMLHAIAYVPERQLIDIAPWAASYDAIDATDMNAVVRHEIRNSVVLTRLEPGASSKQIHAFHLVPADAAILPARPIYIAPTCELPSAVRYHGSDANGKSFSASQWDGMNLITRPPRELAAQAATAVSPVPAVRAFLH
jgi:hypothetical protein